MDEFWIYLQLGFEHISDINGYDHILFLLALSIVYSAKDWKRLLVLITAFTLGHAVTLALSTLDYVLVDSALIEFLIPVTIFLTAVYNIYIVWKDKDVTVTDYLKYGITLCFGFVHGLGFSNYLKMLLGKEESIVQPLLAFNIGLELGQIVIVGIIFLISYVVLDLLKLNKKIWITLISLLIIAVSTHLMIETKFW